jgi:NitT/TauT family transport system substrate-binding protein
MWCYPGYICRAAFRLRRYATAWLLAGLVGFGLGSCRRQPVTPAAPLRVGLDVWAGYYPLVLADQLGYLREEKVAVSIAFPKDTQRMIADFAARRYDLIGVSLGDVVLLAREQPAVRMILCSDESAGGDAILSRTPPGKSQVVRGARIATSIGGFGELFVRRFLLAQGLRPDEVTLINADAAAVPTLLHRGEIDFGHTWEPYATEARRAGCHEWYSSRETPGLILDGLMAHAAVVEARAPELRGLARAWFRAVDWWRAHPAEGNARIEDHLGHAPGSVSLFGVRLLDREDNRRMFASSPEPGALHRAMNEFVDHFVSRGVLSKRIRPEDLLSSAFIE